MYVRILELDSSNSFTVNRIQLIVLYTGSNANMHVACDWTSRHWHDRPPFYWGRGRSDVLKHGCP